VGAAGRHDVAVLHGHTGVVSQLAFTSEGYRLASASKLGRLGYQGDGTVRIWEVGFQAGTFVLRGHTSYVYPVTYSPDGQWIASGSWDKTVRVWDAVTGESCAILPHPRTARAGL
jgi:WD40 repeat protein